MAEIIAKYSDYAIHSINYFVDRLEEELAYRDIKGLTNDKVQILKVVKQHPLATLMAATLQAGTTDPLRSGIIPAISVIPVNPAEEAQTLGVGMQTGEVDAAFIANLDVYLAKTDKERLEYGLLTSDQIDEIKNEYGYETLTLDVAPATDWAAGNVITGQTSGKTCICVEKLTALTYVVSARSGEFTLGEVIGVTGTPAKLADQGASYPTFTANSLLYQIHEWRRTEEINVSAWSDTPDIDILMGNILESILAEIQMGFAGDESPIVNFKYRGTRGLTNFNFGRVLFGAEFNLTFLNTYNNYTIYKETRIDDFESSLTFIVPGES